MAGELDVAAGYGKGFLGGAAAGAAAGKFLGPKGAIIGAIGGALAGGVSGGLKANKARKADQRIQAQDPRELARLAEINRIRKSIAAGTDPLTQQQIQQAKQTGASTQENISRVTGGNVGATVVGLTRAQRGTQAATNQALAQSQQRLPFFENMGQQLSTRISQRALEIGLLRRDQAMAENAAAKKAAGANIAGAIGAAGSMGGAIPKSVPEGSPGSSMPSQPSLIVDQSGGLGSEGSEKGFQYNYAPVVDQSVFDIDENELPSGNMIQQQPTAPVSSVSPMMQIGKQFDQSSVLGPNGLPAQTSTSNPYMSGNDLNQSVNAINTGFNNIDNLGNLPL